MSIQLSSSVMKVTDLMDQREHLEEKINDAAKSVLIETMKKVYDVLEEAGFNVDNMEAIVADNGLMFRMNDKKDREIITVLSGGDSITVTQRPEAWPTIEKIMEWCRSHHSPVDPRDFLYRCKFFRFYDWQEMLLEETRKTDILLEGKCPELTGDFDYTGEWDTFALDGKRYHVEEGQTFIWNEREYTWCCGQPMNDL